MRFRRDSCGRESDEVCFSDEYVARATTDEASSDFNLYWIDNDRGDSGSKVDIRRWRSYS